MQREHVYERPGRSESRRRRRQRQFYRILAAIWLMAFVLGLLCGKLVFAKETGLLARAGAEPEAEESENDRTQTAEYDNGTIDNPDRGRKHRGLEADPGQRYTPHGGGLSSPGYRKSRIITILTAGQWESCSRCWQTEGSRDWTSGSARPTRTMEKQTDLYNNKVSRLQAEGLSYEESLSSGGNRRGLPRNQRA